ncbi:hypothetical protein R3P38DRAFT_3077365, partial [Favolaschia claudopus]
IRIWPLRGGSLTFNLLLLFRWLDFQFVSHSSAAKHQPLEVTATHRAVTSGAAGADEDQVGDAARDEAQIILQETAPDPNQQRPIRSC